MLKGIAESESESECLKANCYKPITVCELLKANSKSEFYKQLLRANYERFLLKLRLAFVNVLLEVRIKTIIFH